MSVPLVNADMTSFSSGVAQYWTSFAVGGAAPPGPTFYPDSGNFQSAPYAQGVSGIDAIQAPGVDFGAGLARQVSVTPGRIYFLVGFQDLFDAAYMPPPARRYAHFFGIEPTGSMIAPQPFTMGAVKWMAPGQWFYNDLPGNSTQIGGLHRCMASCTAQTSQISLWSGVWADGDAATSADPTVFDTDSFMFFEFDNPIRGLLCNPSFDAIDNLTPGYDVNDVHRIALPIYWAPVGGGIGQKESYYTEAAFRRSGSAGLRIYNHRGCLTRGVTQKISVPAGNYGVTFSVYVKSNKNAGTIAKVGVDPTGGDDIDSSNIVWSYYTRTDETWEQISVASACTSGAAVSVFVAASSGAGYTGNVHYADFDDATLDFQLDVTPPTAFTVSAESLTTLTGFLWATVSPVPTDPETGIASIQYAVGTTPGGQEVRAYTTIANPSLITITGLSLVSGQSYYINVKATNGAGLSTTIASDPILCSPKPYTYTWSPAQHLSRAAYSADNARLCADSAGKVYAVWRESNDVTWNGSSSIIMFRERSGPRWGEPMKVNTTANMWWPDVAWSGTAIGVPCLNPGAQLQNTLRVATRSGVGGFSEQYVRNNVSAFPRITYTPTTGWIVGCTLNTTGDPLKGRPVLMIQKPAWTYEMLPEGLYSASDHRVRLWVSGSTSHILWGRLLSGQPGLYYCTRSSQATYSPPRLVTQGVGAGSIAVASGGEVNVVYASGGGVWHTYSTDGVTFQMPRYLGAGSNPSLYADSTGRLHCLFFSPTGSRNESNVDLVRPIHMFKDPDGWSVPTAICGPSCTSGTWAQEPGNLVADSSGGLHFAWSNNPHDRGTQGAQFQGYYWIDYHTTTPVEAEGGEIVQAKLWGDDAPAVQLGYGPSKVVSLASGEVTATGTFKTQVQSAWKSVPYFCVEQEDRASAIKVIAGSAQDSPLPAIAVAPGDLATVSGPIATTNGERTIGYLTSDGVAHGVSYAKSGTASDPIQPLFMSTRAVGGATLISTPGVTGGNGANNVGLLVGIAGTVVMSSTDERGVRILYVDDGSRAPCGPSTGCKVYAPGSDAQAGHFVTVLGVSSIEPYGQSYIRVVMPRDADAVNVITGQ